MLNVKVLDTNKDIFDFDDEPLLESVPLHLELERAKHAELKPDRQVEFFKHLGVEKQILDFGTEAK
jgi:hypothetical protein